MKGVRIEANKELARNHVTVYNKPKYIYIPLIVGKDTDLTVLVKKDDYVCKGEMIARKKGLMTIPLLSSVSGTVVDFEEKLHHTGKMIKCIKIENDFKERIQESFVGKKSLTQYTKDEFIERIHQAGIVGLGGAGFPTYIKYQTEEKMKTLIVNAVECEPYVTADYTVGVEHADLILETIDAILEIHGLEQAYIAVQKGNTKLIDALKSVMGTYVNVKLVLVPNRYPMGWERNLIHYITKENYQQLPIEKGIIVNNLSTIYAIGKALKEGEPLTERVITITGDMIKQPTNVRVKIGTPVHEVIEAIGGMKRTKEIVLVAGGPMMGVSMPSDDVMITADLTAIVVLRQMQEETERVCMRCGKCVSVCPAGIEPVLIKNACQDVEQLRKLDVNKCVECGLCSYICPAKIKVREYVRKAKEILRKEA